MGFVKDTFNAITGRGAEKAANQAADTSAQAQQNALNYLRETEAMPQQFRQEALSQLGGFYGLEGGDPNAQANIEANPMYQATLGQLPQQEEAILRNQSATGGLRSGGTDMMLADNQRMNQVSAYQNAMGGLQGLASIPSNSGQVASGMAGIGNTLAQGQVAGANARQQGIGNMMQMGMNGLAMAGFSDTRLKDNLKTVGERAGLKWYSWTWNKAANALGLSGESEGVLAQDIIKTRPEAVGMRQGYLTVNYELLGVAQ